MGKKVYGVVPPIITPLDSKEHVDEEAFRRLLNHCVSGGLHGIFVAGSNGETMALTQKERDRAIKIALDEVGGRVPVMCGVMDTSTVRVIENIKRLEDMGGTLAVITPVFYARHATQYETVRHFEAIAANTNIELIIYNIPPFTSQNLRSDTVFEITQNPKVVGYKDSSANMQEFTKCLVHFKNTDFSMMQGSTSVSAASMLMGADGYVPSLAPLFPLPFVKMYEYGKAGDIARTMAWNEIIMQIDRIYGMSANQTASTKYAISTLGLCSKRVALPSEPTTSGDEAKIDAQIEKVKGLIDALLHSDLA